MLIVRAPVRISFAGGGTDLEAYYARYGGLVVSTTINKYFYVIAEVDEEERVQITSADYHTFYRYGPDGFLCWDGELALPRAVLEHFGVKRGLSMFLASEVPPGTGLGSSSAVTVALVKALSVIYGQSLSPQELAELAYYIETEKMKMPVGKQDQYASAFGGLNLFHFTSEGVSVHPLKLPPEVLARLESHTLLFFTGRARNSATILSQQRRSTQEDPKVISTLHVIKEMAQETVECLEKGDLRRFGEVLDRAWQYKKKLAPGITTAQIDRCYELARQNGALGGKIAGAGGGGFLMLYCEEEAQEKVTRVLAQEGLRRMHFRFEPKGACLLANIDVPGIWEQGGWRYG